MGGNLLTVNCLLLLLKYLNFNTNFLPNRAKTGFFP